MSPGLLAWRLVSEALFLPTPACARWQLGAWPALHCAREVEQRIATRGRALIGIAESVQMLDFLLGRVRIEAASFAPRITRDLTLRQTVEAQVHNMLVRLSNALAQAGRSLRSGRPLSEVAAELPAAPTKPTDAEAPAP